MPSSTENSQLLEHLLIDQATVGLDETQERELALLMADEDGEHTNQFMETAALVQLGMLRLDVQGQERARREALKASMPADVKARILASTATVKGSADSTRVDDLSARRERKQTAAPASSGWSVRDLGWAVAAALAVAMVLVRPDAATDSAETDLYTLAAQVDAAADSVTLPWAGPNEPGYENVRGEVVWSDDQQAGYMRLAGMPANDAATAQYQLWIVDPERSAQPVDGGVFDVPATGGDVLVPITAKLTVNEPVLFAITLEQPGGVVVSAGPLLVQAAST